MTSGRVGCLLVMLLALLDVGGMIAIILEIGRGEPRWLAGLVALAGLNAVGFALLRASRDET